MYMYIYMAATFQYSCNILIHHVLYIHTIIHGLYTVSLPKQVAKGQPTTVLSGYDWVTIHPV